MVGSHRHGRTLNPKRQAQAPRGTQEMQRYKAAEEI